MKEYIDKINRHVEKFDKRTWILLKQISQPKTFPKGDFLLKAESICTKSYWVQSGIIRKFYVHQDREITSEFYFKGNLATSFDSYTLQKPSREYIQVLSPVVANVTHYADFQHLKSINSQIQALDFLLTEYYAMWLEEKVFELYTQNATQRYETLLKKAPYIIQQVPLTQIASYLNVSLETLSRIRAKI